MQESNPGKSLTLAEAKRSVAILREQGLDAYYTRGQKPKRMLHNAFESKKGVIKRRAQQVFKGLK